MSPWQGSSNPGLICVVDNDPEYRATLRDELRVAGYRVLEAGTPQDLLQLLEQYPVDLILLDVRLRDDENPMDRSGLELLHRLPGSAKVIMLTASKDPRIVRDAFSPAPGAARPEGWLFKDEGFTAIKEAVATALTQARTAGTQRQKKRWRRIFVILSVILLSTIIVMAWLGHLGNGLKNLLSAVVLSVIAEIVAYFIAHAIEGVIT